MSRRTIWLESAEWQTVAAAFEKGTYHPFLRDEQQFERVCAPAWFDRMSDPVAVNILRREYYRPQDLRDFMSDLDAFAGFCLCMGAAAPSLDTTDAQWEQYREAAREQFNAAGRSVFMKDEVARVCANATTCTPAA